MATSALAGVEHFHANRVATIVIINQHSLLHLARFNHSALLQAKVNRICHFVYLKFHQTSLRRIWHSRSKGLA